MRILIDIGHPAHVHYFKHFARIMKAKGHQLFFTTLEKEFEPYLLNISGFDFKKLANHRKSLTGKIIFTLKYNWRLWLYSLKVKPDMYLSAGSISAAHVAWLRHKPFIQLEDSGNMEQIRIYKPFTNVIFSPENIPEQLGPKQIRYRGYQEICFLHPEYFKPDQGIYKDLGITKDTKYAIVRFVSWKASHDIGQHGLTNEEKTKIVKFISSKLRVFISSEGTLPPELEEYRINIPFEKMHDALAFADLFVGEGATMASEAGLLATPSIYINSLVRCYNEDQEKFGTVFNFRNGTGVMEKIEEILSIPEYKKVWEKRSRILINNKINVTQMLVWFVENYPDSLKQVKDNPGILDKF